jgi:GT2 family glycosyltransferase/SAM-dependent methyltransferase
MPNQTPLVSIIIPHTAGTEILLHCLKALGAACADLSTEIILVDNASRDGSVALAKQQFPTIRVIQLARNQGYAGGCDRGIEVATGKYVLLLNDDTETDADCLRELLRTAEADPSIGACQPKIRSLRDKSQFEYSGAAGGLMDVYGYPFSRGRLMGHVEADVGQYDEPTEIFWASGVCMFIRKSVLEEVGALDEAFFAYMEEIDLSWRIHLAGHRIVYVPAALVYHIGGYSLERANVKRMYLNHRNSMIMLAKNYSLRSLLYIFPVKIFLELFIFAGSLIRNRRRSRAVLWSFAWLLTHVPTLLRLRASAQMVRKVSDQEIIPRLYRGMAPIWYFVFGIHQVPDLPDIDKVLHQPYLGGGNSTIRSGTVRPRRRNFLYAYLDQAPVSLALMRAVECNHLSRLCFERPILDIGCGDGTFARILFNGLTVDAGIDQDEAEVDRARATRCYGDLRTAKVEDLPFESEKFATVYSNCVLEHIPNIEGALREIHRVLKPGGSLYITVPSPRCVTFLFWPDVFRRLGLARLGDRYSNLTLRMFKAEHVLEPEQWTRLLAGIGFATEHHESYMPRAATRLQDILLPTAFISVISKACLGRKLIFPRLHRAKIRLYRRFFRETYAEGATEGSATMLVARKASPPDA